MSDLFCRPCSRVNPGDISSRCQQLLGRRRCRRNRRAIIGPNASTQLRTLSHEPSSLALGEDPPRPVVQCEAQIQPCWITTAVNRCRRWEIGTMLTAYRGSGQPARPLSSLGPRVLCPVQEARIALVELLPRSSRSGTGCSLALCVLDLL
jgi:hypothetical protein